MQMSSVFSVNGGASLSFGKCLGIVWVQISRTYQLNEGHKGTVSSRRIKVKSAEMKLFFFDNLSSLLEQTL